MASKVRILLEGTLFVVSKSWTISCVGSNTVGVSCYPSGNEMIDMVRYRTLRDRLVSDASYV